MGGGVRLAGAEATQISLDALEGSSGDVAADTNRHTDDNRVYVIFLLCHCYQCAFRCVFLISL